jgi:hypothetical protein
MPEEMPRNNQELVTKIRQRWGSIERDRSSIMTHWQDITDHLLPRSGRYFVTDRHHSGQYLYNKIVDNTGTRALRILGAGMMGSHTNPARPWFRLETADPDLNQFHPVKVYLEDVRNRMMRVFSLSNTYRVLHQLYEELGAFGTAVTVVLPSFDRVVHHYPVTAGEYGLATDYENNVNALYREFEKTVGQVVREFGWDNVSHRTKDLYRTGNLEAGITILHAIEPRDDRDHTRIDPANKRWRSTYIEQGQEEGILLRDSGFDYMPVLAPRWAVNPGEVYGHSPGMEALGDIRQLQQEQVRKAQAIDYQTMPPLQVPTALKDREDQTRVCGRCSRSTST